MNQKAIDKHRSKYPISIEEISMYSSFSQILGRNPNDFTPEERMKRWDKNMQMLKEAGETELFNFWAKESSVETCLGCVHRNIDKNWCTYAELPCNYNPVLGMLGMECCGLGFDGQQQLLLSE